MTQPIPSLHLVQEKADELGRKGLDVHTMNLVLWDGSLWQVTIEASGEDCENQVFLYELDLYGYSINETEKHYA